MKTISPFKAFMQAATPAEQELLAEKIGTTRGMLYQYSNQHSTRRAFSAERAVALEQATREMAKTSKGRLPVVYRTDVAAACRGCEFARKCLGDEIVTRSEFPVIGE